jgi:hypothetical protein
MVIEEEELRNKIIDYLKTLGFNINPQLGIENNNKNSIKEIHRKKRLEQLQFHKKVLKKHIDQCKYSSISGKDLDPTQINLELIEVKPDTNYSKIFFWWNLVWWSLPYDQPVGRRMSFLLWDKYHNAPFGLFCLQSPTLNSAVRDKFLGLNDRKSEYWINQSLYGQRIGALPPYNELIGGKMVALSIVSNEVRELYAKKYENRETILNKRQLPNRLLFVSTTGAYGKSSVYERLNYQGVTVAKFIGYTSGSGTFHLSEDLYDECLQYLEQNGINAKRGYGTGSSRKLRLIEMSFRYLKLNNFHYHNIKRGYYLFNNTRNLNDVIHKQQEPIWYDRAFSDLMKYWLQRWCLPRSYRINTWKKFDAESFFEKVVKEINNL